MSGGSLLTVAEQIQHMKKKGIEFRLIDENQADHFLTEHTYYTKIAAYRKNYTKGIDGKYVHLDFEYLRELSVIDMHLRYFIMKMSLDIEHALKISLMNDVLANPKEDGYNITRKFLNTYPDLEEKTNRKMLESYCREFYFHNENNLPIWVLIEVLSFGDLIKLYKYYYQVYCVRPEINPKILDNVRNIRNASAHSNCLIHDINHKIDPNNVISNEIKKFAFISDNMRKKYLRKRFTLDFTALLIAHKKLVKSEAIHKKTKKALRNLVFKRIVRNKKYFVKNDVILGAYKYCFLLVKNYFV